MCNTTHNNTNKITSEHDIEHKVWSRRSFMQALGIAGSGSMMLGSNILSASTLSPLSTAISNAENDNILILIRLAGGNDGLNTIIPINQYDLYANARPNIYIPENKLIKINDEFGIPDYMQKISELWSEGQFKAVHGVGYQDQNLSHFTGSEIWSNADIQTEGFEGAKTGWLGRHFEDVYPNYLLEPPTAPAALQIGNFGDILFEGTESNFAFTSTNVQQLEKVAQTGLQYQIDPTLFDECTYDDQLQFLRGVANTTYEYSGVINNAYNSGSNQVEYPNNETSRQLSLLARLIKGNLGTKVFMITLNGFDTHANQPTAHKNLMTELSNSIHAFFKDLAYQDLDSKVLGMTFSEFGRRITENGSRGTDHGKAAPILFFGAGLNGSGLVGEHPELNNPDGRGNLEFNIDFRDVYATVLAEWMCVPIPSVERYLLNHPYNPVDLGFNCGGNAGEEGSTDGTNTNEEGIEINNETIRIETKPYYPSPNEPHIYIKLPKSGHVEVLLYNILGQKMGTLFNEMVLGEEVTINVREKIRENVVLGTYIYLIESSGLIASKKIVM